MKKLLITAGLALGLFATNQSSAQSTANSTFTIVLEDVMSLSVNNTHTNRTLTFDSKSRFIEGFYDQELINYLSVFSNKAYKVTVKAGDVTTNPSSIPLSSIVLALNATDESAGRNTNTTRPSVVLSTTEQNILVSTGSTWSTDNESADAPFDLRYSVGGSAYFDKPAGTNIIPLIFTISAP